MGAVQTIALTMGIGWASGINLYAAVFMLGMLQLTGNVTLPAEMAFISHPAVLFAAGFMYCVEFFADKIPVVDNGWDALHSFIRIPAGAVLAATAVGDVSPAVMFAAGLLGGTLATGSHVAKAGSRVMINTSPEPVTNWFASISEDVIVILGLWTALNHPVLFLVLLLLFFLFVIWLIPKIWSGLKKLFGLIGRLFGGSGSAAQETSESQQRRAAQIEAKPKAAPDKK